MMDNVHKPSDSECYTPLSEPLRFYSLTQFLENVNTILCIVLISHIHGTQATNLILNTVTLIYGEKYKF